MTRLYFLYFFTFLAEMVGGMLPLLWLHQRVTAKFLIPAGIAGAMFFYLLHLHDVPRQKAHTVYAALYLVAVALYYLMQTDGAHFYS